MPILNRSNLFPLALLGLFVFCASPLLALPSAEDLLKECKKKLEIDCETQHTVMKTTTVMSKPGSASVTMIQMVETWKQKPDLVKMITDNGITKEEIISKGNYLYFKHPSTKKWTPVKAPFKIDPFKEMKQTMSGYDQSSVSESNGGYVIRLSGGKLPEIVDYVNMAVDPKENQVHSITGIDKSGNAILKISMEYEKKDGQTLLKKMITEADAKKMKVVSLTEILKNEVNGEISGSVFETKP